MYLFCHIAVNWDDENVFDCILLKFKKRWFKLNIELKNNKYFLIKM